MRKMMIGVCWLGMVVACGRTDGADVEGKARVVIEADLGGLAGKDEKLIFGTATEHRVEVLRERFQHTFRIKLDVLSGKPAELPLTLLGEGEIREVTGKGLKDWGIRRNADGVRVLVLRPEAKVTELEAVVQADQKWSKEPVELLRLAPSETAFFHGYVKIERGKEFDAQVEETAGVVPIEPDFLPGSLRPEEGGGEPVPLAYRFQGTTYALRVRMVPADPEAWRVSLRDFQLVGRLSGNEALFTLEAVARVKNPQGGSLKLLSGGPALTGFEPAREWRLRFEDGSYVAHFDEPGEFPIRLSFSAPVRRREDWNTVRFQVAPSVLQPVIVKGLNAEAQIQFGGAARPERKEEDFVSFLPADGLVDLAWREAKPEEEGKLFYSAEMLAQASVSPGLLRQSAVLDFKVMQGELDRVALLLTGAGELTRVQGEQVLMWTVEPIPDSADRRLVVRFNQPQRDRFHLEIHAQQPIGAFPQGVDVIRIRPEEATRFAGYIRIVNEGAVRLEVVRAEGATQVSPEQFPESGATRALFPTGGTQRFAYRFAGPDFALRIMADQIEPELSVSHVLAYHYGENDLAVEAEIELEIREAPLRELLLSIPKGYAVTRLEASGLSDYFLVESADRPDAELRLVYGQPASGRQMVRLRLERNAAPAAGSWELPRIDVSQARSTRGHVGVSADGGFRLTAERTEGLTEIVAAYFPRKIEGLQAAFRLNAANWQATLRVERLPQTVQADAFHLFSIGEGIAYGSSVINYLVSGAPRAVFQIDLSNEYYNIDFTGNDVRGWQRTTNGYVVQLHTPVTGAYTLLATYERPFRAQGETLEFTGARPLDTQSEQGHTLVISDHQFQVRPVDVSPSLLPLETGEVPPEYRLFFDAPILAAYRYSARPFSLRLALSPLAQGDSLSQVVDRASLTTRISKEGQVLTEAHYLVKNRGNPHLRLTLPAGAELWSATVDGVPVVPVTDERANLIPLPQRTDPNALLRLELKVAARSENPRRVTAAAPIVGAPVMLSEWKLEPDTGQRLVYRRGSLAPAGGVVDLSGFAQLMRLFTGRDGLQAAVSLVCGLALLGIALWVWRWTARGEVYRFGGRHLSGLTLGLVAAGLAIAALIQVGSLARGAAIPAPRDVVFVAPVQQAESALTVEVANVDRKPSLFGILRYGWPVVFAGVVWVGALVSGRGVLRWLGWVCGWVLLCWAALRFPNGAPWFFGVVGAFLLIVVVIPALWRLGQVPRKPEPVLPPGPESGPASAVASALGWIVIWGAAGLGALPGAHAAETRAETARAESVIQEVRIVGDHVLGTATIRWEAAQGETLPVLFHPGVLTGIDHPTNALRLVQAPSEVRPGQFLVAQAGGKYEIGLRYEVRVERGGNESRFVLPAALGLINRVKVIVEGMDVEVLSAQAVSVQTDQIEGNTVATLVLPPTGGVRIFLRPRTRDVTREKPVFYTELFQLYAPSAGVIEGAHFVKIRPAQGELSELSFEVPAETTITDVRGSDEPAVALQPAEGENQPAVAPPGASPVVLWRFDPDARKLRVTLNPPQSRPFVLVIRSQVTTGSLPIDRSVGLVSVEDAAGEIGLLGIATGPEVQLDGVAAEGFSPINLDDFPAEAVQALSTQIPGLAVRRAYRYADAKATVSMKASAVQPDVRVETQETLSLGEDRVVLAVNATVTVTRAGIFQLSFVLPSGMEIDSISGGALSHWTELPSDAGRVVTLHLRGKTEGTHPFAISLAGPGVTGTNGWIAPRLIVREASKQRGTLLVVPEQGMRLQIADRTALTQLDPQTAGIRQKGVLAFRILETPWALALDIEQVAAWAQVTSLQHAVVSEGQMKTTANLQYQIENSGVKSFRLLLPAEAESVRFEGEEIADFLPVAGSATNNLQVWEVKLQRRVIGPYRLHAAYQVPIPAQAGQIVVRGVQALDVNSQRGFVTVQSTGRVQARADSVPEALQSAEWQSIPRSLRDEFQGAPANLTFRLIEPAFQLPLQLERHEAARLLPARVDRITLTSVISDQGVMLTQARLEMVPGDKRSLQVELPADARFWFAFVGEKGVWPWQEEGRVLIPLEPALGPERTLPVDVFYSSRIGEGGTRRLDLELAAPKFDLPLEEITWRVYLSEKWELEDWAGSLRLEEDQLVGSDAAVDFQTYFQKEAGAREEKTRQAEQLLAAGNALLERGDPQQARRAFEGAYGLSGHDDAFNEDARVQLHNLKLQQAIVGLNMRRAAVAGEEAELSEAGILRKRQGPAYTQAAAKQILDRNTAEENAAYMRLAERLVQQQDAAVSSPAAIRASIPEQGRLLVFKRAVVVDPRADLTVRLEAKAERGASIGMRGMILLGIFVMFGLLRFVSQK